MDTQTPHKPWVLILIMVLLVAGVSYEGYILTTLTKEHRALSQKVDSSTEGFRTYTFETSKTLEEMQVKMVEMSDSLYKEQTRVDDLEDTVKSFDRQVGKLSGSVETLEKITTTDPELLQKYSLVYFLNEHYKPGELKQIDEEFDYPNAKQVTIDSNVWPFLTNLLESAQEDGIPLQVLSGYRSFDEQGTLKDVYTVRYGVGANQFSADQGYSEHQLGTTVDFTTPEVGQELSKFKDTKALEWLLANAHKYGFIMSYPENNQYYVYEPWHWRFVGKDLARYLRREEKNFYDVEQRTLDSYIGTIFDR